MSRLLLPLLFFFLPIHLTLASVAISEIAWMGSVQSANHEWIELFNQGADVSVDGWILSDGNNLNITLAGTIRANTYVVLERNRSDGGSVVGTPFLNYSGALVNTGATLTLRRADGSIVDSVAGGENWQNIGGDNITKDTAQYTTGGWITAPPTPGRANATTASSPPTSSSTSTSNKTVLYASTVTTSTSQVSKPSEALSIHITTPTFIYAGQPVSFTVVPNGLTPTIRNSLKYQWNFGDLHTATSSGPTHAFIYPGTYNVVVEGSFASYSATTRQEITVLPLTVSLSHSQKGDVLLHNNAMYEVDISKYYLTATKWKQIPAHTYISPRQTITIPWSLLSTSPFPATVLLSRDREVVTSTNSATKEETGYISTPIESVNVSTSARVTPEVIDNEEFSVVSPFGFATAVAYASQEDEGVDNLENVSVGGEEGDAFGVTPLLASSTPTSFESLPISTWWSYLLFAFVLLGTITAIFYRPKKQL